MAHQLLSEHWKKENAFCEKYFFSSSRQVSENISSDGMKEKESTLVLLLPHIKTKVLQYCSSSHGWKR